MCKGWIKLHRSIMDSETFSKLTSTQRLIAIYIILNANHEDGVWYDKYKDVEVVIKRGQLVVSRNKIVNEWFSGDKEVTEQKVRTCLNKLKKIGFLTINSTKHYTMLEVHNYNVYQQKEKEDNQEDNQAITKQQPSDNQAITTNKNVKNDKNDKNKILFKEFVRLTADEHLKITDSLGQPLTEDLIDRLNNYIGSSGKKYKSHYHTILTWSRKEKPKAVKNEETPKSDNGKSGGVQLFK